MASSEDGSPKPADGFPMFELWDKYEAITMHFNDLLMKLRTQALAGVAALSAVDGIFAKNESNNLRSSSSRRRESRRLHYCPCPRSIGVAALGD